MIGTKRMQRAWTDISVLVVSPVSSYGGFNTSVHRVRALQSLGCAVEVVDSTLGEQRLPGKTVRHFANRLFQHGLPIGLQGGRPLRNRLIKQSSTRRWGLIWLEKALDIDHDTIETVRERCPKAVIVGFSPDDMNARHNQSQQFLDAIGAYDYFLTTKSYNVSELERMGCRSPIFIGNGYDPDAFRPIAPTDEEVVSLGSDVGFIGTYEQERADMLVGLADQGHGVRVWGSGWGKVRGGRQGPFFEHLPLHGDRFSKACSAFKINLNFLRKCNRDRQTTRSVEIPACGGFMLAERSEEHQELFREGREADFFSSSAELSEKCAFYLDNESVRERVARAGYERCVRSGYSNADRINSVLGPLLLGMAR